MTSSTAERLEEIRTTFPGTFAALMKNKADAEAAQLETARQLTQQMKDAEERRENLFRAKGKTGRISSERR